jgi:hypothetical protein
VPDLETVRVRPRSDGTGVGRALWAVVALLAVAILKPWGAGSPGPTYRPVAVLPTLLPATPLPSDDRSAEGLATQICLGAGAWEIVSLETWGTQDVRVWRAIEPSADASGPLDPAIPSVPVGAMEVAVLGWCAPAFGPRRPAGPARVTAWQVRDGAATELALRRVQPAAETPLAALYVPLTTCPEPTICAPLLRDPVPAPWVTGRVVFHYVDAGGPMDVWLAADLDIDAPPASAAP